MAIAETGRPEDQMSCFYFRELPVRIDTEKMKPEVAKTDDGALGVLIDFSLKTGIIDPEILNEQLQKKESKLLHPFTEGLRRQVHNLQTFLQHRPAHTTAA